MRLEDKVAIITGGNTGIGFATARLFAKEGARVLTASRNRARGDAAVAQIRDEGGTAMYVQTDVSKATDVERMVESAVNAWGRVDILFANAGYSVPGNIVTCSEADWDRMIDVDLKGAFLCSKYVLPEMIKAGGGSIIFNSSQQALVGGKNNVAYSAAKGGLISLARAMAIDHAEHQVRVNCVCPAAIATENLINWFEMEGSPDKDYWLKQHPLGRFGDPEDVAKAVLYLASDDASWVTGTILVVDGGFTAH
jgi:meso-butanediol dehydrogenase/(S,S)-butanediol dehydrogenase/diacetyl reductase